MEWGYSVCLRACPCDVDEIQKDKASKLGSPDLVDTVFLRLYGVGVTFGSQRLENQLARVVHSLMSL